ncbi:non-ribosomal peptide synthetase [Streptomyces hintoniae]|uniref:non-ribosomal peptide synthetase n=1 Tax=Streptomyces hintoniae TaxID=3075521 RepID=UPI00288BE5C5|nr:non-ribosomal peptide synthetase [Streptomyces sp. DSM 41014]
MAFGTAWCGSPVASVFLCLLSEANGRTDESVVDVNQHTEFPLNAAQRRVWFAEQFQDVGPSYVLDAALRLYGPLDPDAVERALGELVRLHPMLGARFGVSPDGRPHQWTEPRPPRLTRSRASGSSPEERYADAMRQAERLRTRLPPRGEGAPLAATLIHVAAQEHLFVIAYHHLLGDATSSRLMLRDFMRLYAHAVDPAQARPHAAGPTFADLVDEEETPAHKARQAEQARVTVRRLADAPSVSTVPPDRTRPAVLGPAAHWTPLRLPGPLQHRVARFARACRATPFVVYSAALHLLIQHYTGQRDTLVGYMAEGRRTGFSDVVGFQARTLVQRLRRAGQLTAAEAVAQLADDIRSGMAHGHAPLEDLVRAGHARPTGSQHPLFQAMINYFDLGPDTETVGVRAHAVVVPAPWSWLDLEIRLHHRGDGLVEGYLRCPSELYEARTCRQIARHFARLLEEMTAAPNAPLTALVLLDDEEEARVLAAGRGPSRAQPETLTRLLRQGLLETPGHRPALRFEGTGLTYSELARYAGAVSAWLHRQGVGPDDVVVVSAPRSVELVAAVTGAVLTGAAYLPLDPDEPPTRVAQMLEALTPKAALVAGAPRWTGEETLPHLQVAKVFTQVTDAEITAALARRTEPAPEALAYVIHTSGSTGEPKAVGNTQAGIANRLGWMQDKFSLGADDTVLQKTPSTFDVSVWELFWPLVHGARLALARPGGHRDPGYLGQLIRAERVTLAHFVPSMLRAFVDSGEFTTPLPLRDVICSGEALPPRLCAEVLAAGPYRLHNLYGPTEAAIDVTAHRCVPADGTATSVPIGKAVANTVVRVLDEHGHLQPFGAVGELHLGGVQLARGYLGRQALTDERFVPAPHREGERLYRTGDLARMAPDGRLEFLGRTDRQLKLRGFRVEPGEIEARLEAVPGVRQAVVHFHDGEQGGTPRGLVAFYRADDRVTPQAVAAALAAVLPAHMIPDRYHQVDHIPVLTTGKADRGALTRLDAQETGRGFPEADETPSGPVEAALLEAFRTVLGQRDVALDVSFFALGGDSISSIALVATARTAGVGLQVHEVFTHPTVRQLAAVARPVLPEVTGTDTAPAGAAHKPPYSLLGEHTDLVAALPASAVDAFPLSAGLAGLVVESARPERYRVYLTSLRLRGHFDAQRFRKAAQHVFARHPFLRSSLWRANASAEPLHVVHRSVAVPLTIVDLRGRSGRQNAFRSWAETETRTPFDWYEPPVVRLTVHLLDTDRFRLTLCEPWLDGYSASLVLTELLERYQAHTTDEPSDEAEVVHGYEDFLSGQLTAAEGPSRDFWHRALEDAPPTHLWTNEETASGEPLATHTDVDIPADVTATLRTLNRTSGMPLKSMLLAAHVRALASLTGQSEVITALMSNARPETHGGAEAIGFFLNPTPLRVDVGRGTWWDLVQRLHDVEGTTLPHRAYPYASLLRGGAVSSIGTLFNFTHFHPYYRVDQGGQVRVEEREANDHTYFPLTVQFQLDPLTDRLTLRLEFFGRAVPERRRSYIASLYLTALSRLASGPHHDHHTDPLLVPGERPEHRALPGGRAPRPSTLHGAFARQATRTPAAIAVRSPGGDLTYAEVASLAARLSTALRRFGLRPGDPVGVCLPRTPHLVAAVIGVLAAGGVYMPLDPALSITRHRAMAERAHCRLLIVDDSTRELTVEGTRQVRVDLLLEQAAPGDLSELVRTDDHRQPAYLVFTSGSTGAPKGVLVSHGAVHNRLRWGWRTSPYVPGELACARTPIAFVDSVAELLSGLLQGTPTYLVPDEVHHPDELAEVIAREGITRVTLVPTLLGELLRGRSDLSVSLRSVRHWTVSGEALPVALAHELLARLPGTRIHNLYGSSEVAGDVSGYEVRGDETGPSVPIGTAVDGCVLSVVDAWGNPVPRGTVGELVVSGIGVGLGYWRDPALTDARFVPDRWASLMKAEPSPTGRAFRTGDLAVVNEEGNLEYRGRVDRRMKIRGVRLEPTEIESALRRDPEVLDAVVMSDPDASAPRCVAVLMPGSHAADIDVTRLRRLVADQVSAAAVPEVFAVAGVFPRTATGKVDRSELWRVAQRLDAGSIGGGAARTEVEERLASLWRERLGLADVERGNDFFDLGGHSLHAVLLSSAIHHSLGVRLKVSEIFAHPVLADQAELVTRRLSGRPANGS